MIFTMAKKELVFETGKGGNSDGITTTDTGFGMRVYVSGVSHEDLIEFVTPEEIAEEANLGELLKALVKKHGLGEVIYVLVENNDTTEIIKEVYGADDDAVRSWVVDTFGSEE